MRVVAAIRATLEGIGEGDLLLQVADAFHPMAKAQVDTVRRVLSKLDAADKPALLLAALDHLVAMEVKIPYSQPALQSRVFRQGAVDWYKHGENGARIRAHVHDALSP